MSTRGFMAIKTGGETVGAYNHSDSYPTWLGVRMVELIRTEDVGALAEKIKSVVPVDENGRPTPEQSADLKARGFWADVSDGEDWYSHLRNAQGSLVGYIEAGYIPALDVYAEMSNPGSWLQWGYIIDVDAERLEIYEGTLPTWMKRASLPFDTIRSAEFDASAYMESVETND